MIEIFREILPIAIRCAPMIAGALGSPLSSIALELLAQAFGGTSADPADLADKIKSNPNAEGILATLETQHAPYFKALRSIKMPNSAKLTLELNWPDPQ